MKKLSNGRCEEGGKIDVKDLIKEQRGISSIR